MPANADCEKPVVVKHINTIRLTIFLNRFLITMQLSPQVTIQMKTQLSTGRFFATPGKPPNQKIKTQ
jgi:hypothetical protein